jgi:hypothetical protein
MLRRLRNAWTWIWAHRWTALTGLCTVLGVVAGALLGRRSKPITKAPPKPVEAREERDKGKVEAYSEQAAEAGGVAEEHELEARPRPIPPSPPLEDLDDEEAARVLTERGW